MPLLQALGTSIGLVQLYTLRRCRQASTLPSSVAPPLAPSVAIARPWRPRRSRPLVTAVRAGAYVGSSSGAGGGGGGGPDGGAKQYLYEGQFGLPVVRRRLGYGELLRAVREREVAELLFFSQEGQLELEGPCIVVFHDGTTAQAYVPENDFRMAYAMETHGVRGRRLEPTPTPQELQPPRALSEGTAKFLTTWAPYLAVALIYAATAWVRHMKGDAEDRDKLRAKKKDDERREALKRRQELLADEVAGMAEQGKSVDEILAVVSRKGHEIDPDDVEEAVAKAAAARAAGRGPAHRVGNFIVGEDGKLYNVQGDQQLADEQAFRDYQEELAAEDNPQKAAEQMLKMKTAKIQMARDPEKQRRLREAQRKLGKGVQLQYTDGEPVFFEDVAGIGDAKVELREVVDFFRKPERFRESGSRIPRGVLLCGPPGTGKTLLARAVAGEAGATFLSLNASEFVEMFVGVGASRVRDLFAQARAFAPAIIFIDEIDSVGRVRGGAKGNDERDQTLNQMLSEMDGFDSDSQVIVMAATNRKDILDPALIRPGRFDRVIYVGLPDYYGRIEILTVHLAKRKFSDDIDFHELAFETASYSGAMLANLVNTAATLAGQDGRDEICNIDMFKALEEERLGPLRATPYSADARRRLAVMEAATSLACTLLPAIEPVTSVTIVPREKYPLGQTVLRANEDREITGLYTRRYLQEQLLTVLAGRAAEELYYGPDEMSTIHQRRLVLARRIVTKLIVSSGFAAEDPRIGPRTISFPSRAGGGRALKQLVTKFVPPEVHEHTDAALEEALAEGYAQAWALMQRNRPALDRLVELLLEKDSLTGEVVRAVAEQLGHPDDLAARAAVAGAFL